MIANLFSRMKISKIGIQPPSPAPGRYGIGLAVILRNEGRHVGEWVRFHQAAGVRRFIVYDDACEDETIPELRRALPAEALTVVKWGQRMTDARLNREIHNQVLAYAHAASNFGADLRWLGFIDVDEFLVPKSHDSLPAALEELGDVRNLSLPWHMFGTCGHDTPPDGGVVRNYLQRATDPMSDAPGVRAFKCLADPCHITSVRVHSLETDGSQRTNNDRGEAVAATKERDRAGFYSAELIQLNHYYTRSRQELEAKIGRGPNLASKSPRYRRKVLRTVANIERDTVEDFAARDFAERVGL